MYLSLYCKGSKRATQGFSVRGSWRPNRAAIYWPHSYGHQRCVFLVLQGCSTGGPGAQLSAECWLSLPHLVTNGSPKLLVAPRAPSAGCGFPYTSYQQLLWTPTHQGLQGPLRPGVAFPTTRLYNSNFDFLSWLSYIIVQRPFNLPLNLWNGMFDRHQAEITVMQFIGHSLPVHQSMSVPWDFFALSHFISQIPPTRFILITSHWDVSLPSDASLWNGIFARVEGQNTTKFLLGRDSELTEKLLASSLSLRCTDIDKNQTCSPPYSVGDVLLPLIFSHSLRLNMDAFIKCLKEVVLSWIKRVGAGRRYNWQQDSAPCHSYRGTQC